MVELRDSDFLRKTKEDLRQQSQDYHQTAMKVAAKVGFTEDFLAEYGSAIFEVAILEQMRKAKVRGLDQDIAGVISEKGKKVDKLKLAAVSANLPDIALSGLSMHLFAYRQQRIALNHVLLSCFGAGLFVGGSLSTVDKKTKKQIMKDFASTFARSGAEAKLANDPKQIAKADAFELWKDWQSGKLLHKSGAAFARFVCDKYPVLESSTTVERWARKWKAEEAKTRH